MVACCAPSPPRTASGGSRPRSTDVDPVYLALLKDYEDRRFDDHWGVDPFAVVRAAGLWIARGHIVSGASTLSMQAARLLEPRPRSLPQQGHRGRPRAAARVALFQARGAGDLPDAGADGRQPRGRALGLLRLFRQGAAPAQRRRGGPAGRHPAIADPPPAGPLARRRASRPRRRPAARPGARRDRSGAVRLWRSTARCRRGASACR